MGRKFYPLSNERSNVKIRWIVGEIFCALGSDLWRHFRSNARADFGGFLTGYSYDLPKRIPVIDLLFFFNILDVAVILYVQVLVKKGPFLADFGHKLWNISSSTGRILISDHSFER